ncbi:MAG: 50S ribosome-binding GTPase [Candidatus Shikimatogenerans bostrichidophilus]|nr:MAG: 50S ribosome-binding GTPase [Candidatus Shikimatogenerans bostrichidophilus]
MKYSNIISIIGLTNVGKSYIYNKILGKYKSYIHKKNNFTINLIYNTIYINKIKNLIIDTPGYNNNNYNKFSYYLRTKILDIIDDSNIIIYITKNNRYIKDNIFLKKIRNKINNKKSILIFLNKKKEKINLIYLKYFKLQNIIIINKSIKINKLIINKLAKIINNDKKYNYYFYEDNKYYIIDSIRNLIYTEYYKEIPYSIFIYNINIIKYKFLYKIIIYIVIEKESQRKILIGYNMNKINVIKKKIRKLIDIKYKIKNIRLEFNIKILRWKNNNLFLKKNYI